MRREGGGSHASSVCGVNIGFGGQESQESSMLHPPRRVWLVFGGHGGLLNLYAVLVYVGDCGICSPCERDVPYEGRKEKRGSKEGRRERERERANEIKRVTEMKERTTRCPGDLTQIPCVICFVFIFYLPRVGLGRLKERKTCGAAPKPNKRLSHFALGSAPPPQRLT